MKHAMGAAVMLLALAGCSAAAPSAPGPSGSAAAVDHTEQATIDGEWTLTRTVASSDDVNNAAHAVAAVSTRLVKFGDINCSSGPCTGGVLSGPTMTTRDSSTFASSGNTITYEFSGYLNCVRQDNATVLVTNGYSYSAVVTLTVIATDAADATKATTLEGTMTYTDTVTNAALEAGCTRDPVTATTEYTLSAVRAGEVVPAS